MANGVKAKAGKAWHGKCRPGKVQYNRSAHEAGRPRCGLMRLWSECGGVGRSEDRPSDLPYGLSPTYHLCLSLSIPTPISLQQKKTTTFRLLKIYVFIYVSFIL